MIITIDGPVATGKSTVAKKVAEKLGFIHFDTGAIYRCVTAFLLKHKVSYQNETILNQVLKDFSFEIVVKNGIKHYFVEGDDVTQFIRGEEVTKEVSHVAAIKQIREKLVTWQREWAKKDTNAVFEGRDLGSVVFPHAQLKIYLTGSDEVRARRRYEEMVHKFPEKTFNLNGVLSDLKERDHLDMTRSISPLRKAPDAIEIDTSNLSVDEVVQEIVNLAGKRR
jgi:cytidylate kinase